MRRTQPLALAFLIAFTACAGVRRPAEEAVSLAPGDIWIRDVTLVSLERQMPLPHAHVVVRDGRILLAGTTALQTGVDGVTIVAGDGKILPGLIDGHVHLGACCMRPDDETGGARARPGISPTPRSYLLRLHCRCRSQRSRSTAHVERIRSTELGPAVFDCGNALAPPTAIRWSTFRWPSVARYPNFRMTPTVSVHSIDLFRGRLQPPEAAVARVAAGEDDA
jgi:hypothetical protein